MKLEELKQKIDTLIKDGYGDIEVVTYPLEGFDGPNPIDDIEFLTERAAEHCECLQSSKNKIVIWVDNR